MNLHKLILTKNECYINGVPITPVGVMVHSTGINNKRLSRYVGPNDGLLGENKYGNHWNQFRPDGRQVCAHAMIGELADGTIATYQTLPWDMRGWHSGKGSKGSANNMGYIGFEICEDGLTDPVYFGKVYREAVELTAYICNLYGLDPTKDGVVICHSEGHKRGIASNHGDVMHWFPKHGKSMDTFRAYVAAEMTKTGHAQDQERENKKEDELDMDIQEFVRNLTDEQAYTILTKARRHALLLPEPDWSKAEGHWQRATDKGIVDGTSPNGPMTRVEVVTVMGRGGLL